MDHSHGRIGEAELRDQLDRLGQSHVLRFWSELDGQQREELIAQLASIRWEELSEALAVAVQERAGQASELPRMERLEPVVPWPRIPDDCRREQYARARERAHEMLRAGSVAMLTVAGGQGSRLGFNGPKGAFPIGPVSGSSLFEGFAGAIRRASERYGRPIPWYIMTSPATHAGTLELFASCGYFGLDPGGVRLFQQGQMPVVSRDGRILLASKGRVAMAPDGHGGLLGALAREGILDDWAARGVEVLSVFQVDNPLVRCVDPLFLGLHAITDAEVSCKVIRKRDDREGLGNLCWWDGRLVCIEYSDFPDAYAAARGPDGERRYAAGGISVYVFSAAFLSRLAARGDALAWHRAVKRVAFVGDDGEIVEPAAPNAVKLERFLFDVLPHARRPLVMWTHREDEFSPVKNLEGVDSVESCRRDLIRRACAWLEAAGIAVPRTEEGEPDATIEISPAFADSEEDLVARMSDRRVEVPRGGVWLVDGRSEPKVTAG